MQDQASGDNRSSSDSPKSPIKEPIHPEQECHVFDEHLKELDQLVPDVDLCAEYEAAKADFCMVADLRKLDLDHTTT